MVDLREDEPIVTMTPEEEAEFLKGEIKELGEILTEYDRIVEQRPYSPNRATRRARADYRKRQNRAKSQRKKRKK